jgi:hypothetical protein
MERETDRPSNRQAYIRQVERRIDRQTVTAGLKLFFYIIFKFILEINKVSN